MFDNTAERISHAPACVLVVDDDKSSLMWMRLLLEQSGFLVETARSGHEALNKTETFHPKFIITDLKLPDFSGLELAERVSTKYPSIDFFCVSGFSKDVLTAEEHKLFKSYLVKPFDFDILINLLKKNSSTIDLVNSL